MIVVKVASVAIGLLGLVAAAVEYRRYKDEERR